MNKTDRERLEQYVNQHWPSTEQYENQYWLSTEQYQQEVQKRNEFPKWNGNERGGTPICGMRG